MHRFKSVFIGNTSNCSKQFGITEFFLFFPFEGAPDTLSAQSRYGKEALLTTLISVRDVQCLNNPHIEGIVQYKCQSDCLYVSVGSQFLW